MNQPLLQWKREIEDEIEQLKQLIIEDEINRLSVSGSYIRQEEKIKQLQMIEDIIKDIDKLVRISYYDSFAEKDYDKSLKLHDIAIMREEFAKRIIGELE